MVKQLMRDVSERMIMNSEKTLDILQGILVHVGWYHPHLFWGQQVTNLLHLAMALVVDLGIDRPPQECKDIKSTTTRAVHGPSLAVKVPTLDEHRALAGTYYLTSMLSSSFKKMDPMGWTKFLEEALNSLEQSNEFEGDLLLVQMTRLQHLMQETSSMELPTAPMSMYVKAFNSDLDRLRRSDPCKDTNNVLLRMQYVTDQILVWELSLIDLQENKSKPSRSHFNDLSHLVETIKSFVDVYFSIPTSDYLIVPFSAFGQFAHAFIVLVKLASLDVEGWDIRAFCDILNFSKVIDEAANRFDDSAKSAPDGLRVNNDCFGKWAHRLRWMKQVYEAKFVMEKEDGEDGSDAVRAVLRPMHPAAYEDPVTAGVQQQPTPPDDVLSGDFFNYLDENFWNSFAGDFDLGFPEMAMT